MAKRKKAPAKKKVFKQHRAPRTQGERTAPYDFTRIFASGRKGLSTAQAARRARTKAA